MRLYTVSQKELRFKARRSRCVTGHSVLLYEVRKEELDIAISRAPFLLNIFILKTNFIRV